MNAFDKSLRATISEARKLGYPNEVILHIVRINLGASPVPLDPAPPPLYALPATTRRVYAFWLGHCREHGLPPTMREAMTALNISSTSVMSYHLSRLVKCELLRKWRGSTRNYRLPPSAWPGRERS